jgi:hypothetical protein
VVFYSAAKGPWRTSRQCHPKAHLGANQSVGGKEWLPYIKKTFPASPGKSLVFPAGKLDPPDKR